MAPATPPVVPRILADYGEMTRAAMEHYLSSERPQKHLDDLIIEYPRRGGKMMRSSICIATAKAFGARIDEAIATATAIELLHNALLIHDDIQDESETRRGEPALHQRVGVPLAINAGDALSLRSMQPLLANLNIISPQASIGILQDAERMARESAEGQAMELGWRFDNQMALDDSDYLTMVLKKTCWLATIFPCRAGAMIGCQKTLSYDAFLRFGFFLGSAFQIQDDILNLLADKRYGKERDGDLWEGKRTLVLLHVYRHSDAKSRERIKRIVGTPRAEKKREDVIWLRRQVDELCAIEYASAVAHGLAGAAHGEFTAAFAGVPESDDKRFIEGLITWVFERG